MKDFKVLITGVILTQHFLQRQQLHKVYLKRRIEINIETRRAWIVRPARQQSFSFCGECNEHVRMLSADEAAIIARVSPRIIYRWIEAGEIHFAETPDGLILICLTSLGRADEGAMIQRFTSQSCE